jgi:hypothetical protein
VPLCGGIYSCTLSIQFTVHSWLRWCTCPPIYTGVHPTQKTVSLLCHLLTHPSASSVKHTLRIVHVHSTLLLLWASILYILPQATFRSMPHSKVRTIQQTLSLLQPPFSVLEAVNSGSWRLPPFTPMATLSSQAVLWHTLLRHCKTTLIVSSECNTARI